MLAEPPLELCHFCALGGDDADGDFGRTSIGGAVKCDRRDGITAKPRFARLVRIHSAL
jgi:hypothetical protein